MYWSSSIEVHREGEQNSRPQCFPNDYYLKVDY